MQPCAGVRAVCEASAGAAGSRGRGRSTACGNVHARAASAHAPTNLRELAQFRWRGREDALDIASKEVEQWR